MGLRCFIANKKVSDVGQRLSALFFIALILAGASIPTASAYAADRQMTALLQQNTHKGTPPDTTTPMKQDYPGGTRSTVATVKAAQDARPTSGNTSGNVLAQLNNNGIPPEGASQGKVMRPTINPRELTDQRTATTSVMVNSDGTLTEKQYLTPKFFQKNGAWRNIDTSLVEDKNAGDSNNIFGKALGQVQSWVSSTINFQVKENDWQARFSPSGSPSGMVRIKKESSQIGFSPVGAKDIAPVITTDSTGRQTVHYYDLWPGVNVEYTVGSAELKENVIIKDRNATT